MSALAPDDIAIFDICVFLKVRVGFMSALLPRVVRTLLLATSVLLGALSLGSDRAAATTVTVDGQTFTVIEYARDVKFNTLNNFAGNTDLLPWWGNATKAEKFAMEFAKTLISPIERTYAFVYALSGAQTQFVELFASADGPTATLITNKNISSDATGYSWMAVPEIDGPVLARMGLIVSVLCIGLMALRGRAAGDSPRA